MIRVNNVLALIGASNTTTVSMIKVLHRPAKIKSSYALDAEFNSVRWVYNRLLDFEDQHQAVMDSAAEHTAPGIIRVGRLVSRLNRRKKRLERSSQKTLGYHPELLEKLKVKLQDLRKLRDKEDLWKAAKKWDLEPADKSEMEQFSISEKKVRQQAGESDEEFSKRKENVKPRTRRELHELRLYREIRCYYDSYSAAKNSINQAKKMILKLRKNGLSAKFNRPRWSDRQSLTWQIAGGEKNQKKVIQGKKVADVSIVKDGLWWTITAPIGCKEFGNRTSITFRIKGGNWHPIPEDAKVSVIQLTKTKSGNTWKYSVSITIDGSFEKKELAQEGSIGIDWGHREISKTIRAFTWTDQDNKSGEIVLPESIRESLDLRDQIKSDLDKAYDTRKLSDKLPFKNRFQYRNHLMRLGVLSSENSRWLEYETKQTKRILRLNNKIDNLRKETYTKNVLKLRCSYSTFYVENLSGKEFQELGKEQMSTHRSRQNRDVVARYKFNTLAAQYGAKVIEVEAKNSTRECPDCGTLAKSTKDLTIVCPGCGKVRDRDHGASKVILRRGMTFSAGVVPPKILEPLVL